ncbi:hypothetical protein Hanom_Chr11g01001531 [Helianthus anomalus]
MSVRAGPQFSSPQASSNYPPIPEDPQMGGPSNVASVIDTTPATFAQQQPTLGFENQIPTYSAETGFNQFEPRAPTSYNYQPPAYDPYVEASVHNAFFPFTFFPPAYPTGYPTYGYQYP